MRYTRKNPFLRGLLGSSFVALALLANLTPAWSQGESTVVERPYLMAQGRGEVSVKPDVAYVQVGVRTEAKEVTQAVQENATRMDAVLKAIRAAGIEEKDINTVNYAISPVYAPASQLDVEPKQTGYQVINSVRITVRKIADAGKMLDAATQAGANFARGISFDLSKEQRDKAYAEALTMAVKEARQKIIIIAKASEAGRITFHSVTEQDTGNFPQPMAAFAEARGGAVSTPVVAGQMNVTASVTVRYSANPEFKQPNY